MIEIIKYNNRKLYCTQSKDYISLDDIFFMIHDGENVKIICKKTGEDITIETLKKVLFFCENLSSGQLHKLIRLG